ncbi:hypothetical protein D3C78_1966980 [compost metagenome]
MQEVKVCMVEVISIEIGDFHSQRPCACVEVEFFIIEETCCGAAVRLVAIVLAHDSFSCLRIIRFTQFGCK